MEIHKRYLINSPCFRKNAKQCIVLTPPCGRQGQTGRVFQLRVGSCSGIEKIFQVGLGIGYLYQIPSKLGISGIEILIGHSPSISLISYIFLYLISYLINMFNQTCFWWTDICHYGPVWQKLAAFWGPQKISRYPKISNYYENISGRVRVLLKIIGSGIGYLSDTGEKRSTTIMLIKKMASVEPWYILSNLFYQPLHWLVLHNIFWEFLQKY